MTYFRSCLFAAAAIALLASASGRLSPALSDALWLLSAIALVCHRSSPVRRAVERALIVPCDAPEPATPEPARRELPVAERRAA